MFTSQEILEKTLLCVGISRFLIPGLLVSASGFETFVCLEFPDSLALFCSAPDVR